MKSLLGGLLCFFLLACCCCALIGCGKPCKCKPCPCKPCPCKDKCPCGPEHVALTDSLHVTGALAKRPHCRLSESVSGPVRRWIHRRRHSHCHPCYTCQAKLYERPPATAPLPEYPLQSPGGAVASAGSS